MSKAHDLTGLVFGRLTVVSLSHRDCRREAHWICVCSCGETRTVGRGKLKSGDTASCGCIRSEQTAARNAASATHGMSETPTYGSWMAMRSRCSRPSMNGYENYGGRGISVCARWLTFANFLADMGVRSPGTTLDRIDNDGNYEPGNCRWATPKEQTAKRRNRGRYGRPRKSPTEDETKQHEEVSE